MKTKSLGDSEMRLARPVRTDIEYSSNTEVFNKPDNNYYTTYRSGCGDIDEILRIIKRGHSICPSQFKKNERKLENVIQSGIIIIDVDNGNKQKGYEHQLTIAEALDIPFVRSYCKIYTTASNTPEWNRFRVLLPLPLAVDAVTYKIYADKLDVILGGSGDKVAMHSAVGFYGNTEAWISENEIEGLPWSWVNDLEKEVDVARLKQAEREAQRAKAQTEVDYSNGEVASDAVSEMLQFISSDCDYETWSKVCCAIGTETKWSEEGLTIFDNWSANATKYKGRHNIEKKWYSYQGGSMGEPITIASLIYLAKQNGYVRTVQKRKETIEKDEYTPTHSDCTRYVADKLREIYKEDERGVFGVRAPKNTGKSYWLKEVIEQSKGKVILLGDRRVLTKTLSAENNLNYIGQSEDREDAVLAYSDFGKISCVVDSTLKLDSLFIDGGVLIIDEAEQFVDSLLNGQTHISKFRGEILYWFRSKLHFFDKIILCDADLSDETVSFFSTISNMPVIKYENTYRENERPCFLYSTLSTLHAQMQSDISEGKNVMYVTDSQKQAEVLSRKYTRQGIETLLLTRDSISDKPELHYFMANKGEKMRWLKKQVVLVSPVMQSGVSIELGDYFHAVYGNFQGVIPPKTASQLLGRDRSNCARHVYCSPQGIAVEQLFTPSEVLDNELHKEETLIEVLKYLQYSDPNMDYILNMNRITMPDKFYTHIMKHKARTTARKNESRQWFKSSLIEQLRQDGYEITYIDTKKDSEIDMKKELEILDRENASRIVSAELIDEEQKKRLQTKETLNNVEKAQLSKAILHSTLPHFSLDLDEEFVYTYVLRDRYKTIRAVENNFLINNTEYALDKDVRAIKGAFKRCPAMPLVGEVKNKTRLISLWNKLQLSTFLDKEITGNTSERFKALCQNHTQILRVFNIVPTAKGYGIRLMKTVFALFGYAVNKIKFGTHERIYAIEKIPLFDELYTSIETRYIEAKERRLQKEKDDAIAESKKLSSWYRVTTSRIQDTVTPRVFCDQFS